MIHKDYELLATFAGETLDETQRKLLADTLEQDNKRFNRGRFLAACDEVEKLYGDTLRMRLAATVRNASPTLNKRDA